MSCKTQYAVHLLTLKNTFCVPLPPHYAKTITYYNYTYTYTSLHPTTLRQLQPASYNNYSYKYNYSNNNYSYKYNCSYNYSYNYNCDCNYNYTTLHCTRLHPAVLGEATTATTTNCTVHQWIRPAIHASQQLTSSIWFPISETSATALCGTIGSNTQQTSTTMVTSTTAVVLRFEVPW